MFEFTLRNIHNNKETYAFGYSFENAIARAKLNPQDWVVDFYDYYG